MKNLLIRILLSGVLALPCMLARADVYVVVHEDNPVRSLTHKNVVDIFMGRSRAFSNGQYALPFDLPRDSAGRQLFYQLLTGLSLAQVNSYWSRLMFTGQTMPPVPLPGEAVMLDVIRQNPGAIGYVTSEPTGKGVRIVLVLKDTPAAP